MVFFLPVRNLWSVGCRPADATMYDGRGYDGEENAFGFFDGSLTPALCAHPLHATPSRLLTLLCSSASSLANP